MGFDKSFYESAKIDGATRWQQIKYITLPLLRPTIIMLTMMAIGRIFYSDFGLFYQVPMNQGALYSTTNTIDTYVYRGLLQMGNVSMSAAARCLPVDRRILFWCLAPTCWYVKLTATAR